MKTLEELKDLGIDVDSAMNRFLGDEKMYRESLNEFLDDKNFDKLSQSLNEDQRLNAFHAAHALKGVAANLSLTLFDQIIDPIVEHLRAGNRPSVMEVQKLVEERERLRQSIE